SSPARVLAWPMYIGLLNVMVDAYGRRPWKAKVRPSNSRWQLRRWCNSGISVTTRLLGTMKVPQNMTSTKARAVPMPSNSVLAPLYVGADLLDAFAIQLPAEASDDLEVLARTAFEHQA